MTRTTSRFVCVNKINKQYKYIQYINIYIHTYTHIHIYMLYTIKILQRNKSDGNLRDLIPNSKDATRRNISPAYLIRRLGTKEFQMPAASRTNDVTSIKKSRQYPPVCILFPKKEATITCVVSLLIHSLQQTRVRGMERVKRRSCS